MSVTRQQAERAASVVASGAEIDPAMVIAILEVIVTILKVLLACGLLVDQALAKLQKPGVIGTVHLRRILRSHEAIGDRRYKVEMALRAIGRTVTTAELTTMFAELN